MRLFNKIAIVGLGLIGGSLALAIKKNKMARTIIGISRHKKTLQMAKKLCAVDIASSRLEILNQADFVILAMPVKTIIELAPSVAKIINKDALVTDVGSTKYEIVKRLSKVFTNFVGAHPLAGSEKSGIINARSNLFRDSLCILTPTPSVRKEAVLRTKYFWQNLDAKVFFLEAGQHDRILAFISHLPHILAFCLISTTPGRYLKFAPASLKDATRVAASDSRLWEDIILSNRNNILKTIDLLEENLSLIKTAIKQRDKILLSRILRRAKRKRDTLK
jgi:prephenate dehydrogenase